MSEILTELDAKDVLDVLPHADGAARLAGPQQSGSRTGSRASQWNGLPCSAQLRTRKDSAGGALRCPKVVREAVIAVPRSLGWLGMWIGDKRGSRSWRGGALSFSEA